MEQFIEIARICAVAISGLMLVASIVLSILTKSKNKKVSSVANDLLVMTEECRKLMTTAESIIGFGGATKKEWVLVKLNDYAIKHNINFDEQQMSEIVEKFMELANSINVRVEETETVQETETPRINESPVVESNVRMASQRIRTPYNR